VSIADWKSPNSRNRNPQIRGENSPNSRPEFPDIAVGWGAGRLIKPRIGLPYLLSEHPVWWRRLWSTFTGRRIHRHQSAGRLFHLRREVPRMGFDPTGQAHSFPVLQPVTLASDVDRRRAMEQAVQDRRRQRRRRLLGVRTGWAPYRARVPSVRPSPTVRGSRGDRVSAPTSSDRGATVFRCPDRLSRGHPRRSACDKRSY